MGALKSGHGQRQGTGFKKRNQWWQEDGDVVFRVLPASDKFTDDPYKWIQYHAVVKGYKNTAGKLRMFESTLQKKNKEIVTPDAAVERIESLREALEKARKEGNGPVTKQLNDLVGMRGVYSVEKKYHMNVMNLEGAVGTLGINYTAKEKLDIEIKKLQDKGVDPLSLDNGRFFVFSRSNTGGKATFDVRVLEEEVEIPGRGKGKMEVVAKNITDSWNQIERDMVNLEDLYIKITPEEVAQIVAESDLKTGKSPACDRIFDARWKAQREARKAQQEQSQDDNGPDDAHEDTAIPYSSSSRAISESTASVPVSTPAPAEAKSTPSENTQAKDIDDMPDDEFFKMIGVQTAV